jgi:hypothetical protein
VSKRFTLYDGAGNPTFSSEWVADSTSESVSANLSTGCVFTDGTYGTARPSAAPGTYSMCWDPFGRPQQIVGAKHSSLAAVDRLVGRGAVPVLVARGEEHPVAHVGGEVLLRTRCCLVHPRLKVGCRLLGTGGERQSATEC